jgi:hypothetical protein
LNSQIWWENNDGSILQRKSTIDKNERNASILKYDVEITMEVFYNVNQQKRRTIKVVQETKMMRK